MLTFTLTWSADADLDLWFECDLDAYDKTRVYYGNKQQKKCDSKLDVDMREDKRVNIRLDGTQGQIENIYANKLEHQKNYTYTVHKYEGNDQPTYYTVWVMRRYCTSQFTFSGSVCLDQIKKVHKDVLENRGDKHEYVLQFDENEQFQYE